ncbi:class IIb bacteriocin, lactobin A/cerein 7B family [Caldicellulosiruptor morganii]|uniref:Class IIb bacteriocin, lactobin A/cerein 7B family n=1 Tax=Caldicellulosiruptor morganii TaxID=1387555 RepID=A0ABY7BLL9_9FIRM|nr:class IIb bacteriocin, lactobin A/cerein 7B family [Caldicellulosiruptor morganii]WAM32792.1 class IIb bacteriocin, lactobin A/cerein 7B family [Caldicellulosiruptor morganii]
MVNECLLKKGYFVELDNNEMECVNGGWLNVAVRVVTKVTTVITLIEGIYENAKKLYDFGRGFVDGFRDAMR